MKLTGFVLIAGLGVAGVLAAQDLNWDGATGIWTTPTASTAPSPAHGFGMPALAYHFVDTGRVIGGFNQFSITEGVAGRFEFGYSRAVHLSGGDPALSPLWSSGFNTFHAKTNLLRENAWKTKWVPALSGGFVTRSQVRNAGGWLTGKDTTNADFYLVATKIITETKYVPLLLNAGYKATNASIFGISGNAPAFTGRAFGALGFVFKGPAKSTFVLVSEVSQQPKYVQDLPGVAIPTTVTYAVRFAPHTEHGGLNVDVGVAHVANHVAPGVDLNAMHQLSIAVSYALPGK